MTLRWAAIATMAIALFHADFALAQEALSCGADYVSGYPPGALPYGTDQPTTLAAIERLVSECQRLGRNLTLKEARTIAGSPNALDSVFGYWRLVDGAILRVMVR